MGKIAIVEDTPEEKNFDCIICFTVWRILTIVQRIRYLFRYQRETV